MATLGLIPEAIHKYPQVSILHEIDYILQVHVAPGCHDQLLAHGSVSQATDASEIEYHYLIVWSDVPISVG